MMVAGILVLGLAALSLKEDEKRFQISKGLNIFATLFRDVNTFYVDDVDPEQMVQAGIDAMRSMSDGSERASDNMLLLLVVNAVSVQLIPATVIALRAAGGSADASSVILPIFLSSLAATVVGVVLSKIFSGASRAK